MRHLVRGLAAVGGWTILTLFSLVPTTSIDPWGLAIGLIVGVAFGAGSFVEYWVVE